MPAVVRSPALDFAADLPDAARATIRALLEKEPKGARKVYAALARKVWSLLVERRFDDEIRDWHDLLHGVKAHIRAADGAAAERLTALADLLRESISLAQTSPAREVANRPRARRILEILDGFRSFVARRALQDELAIGSSHLSNVLTQLVAHDLVDRRDKGKEAEFRITPLGRQLIGADGVREDGMREDGAREREAAISALVSRVQDLGKVEDLAKETLEDALGVLPHGMIIMDFGGAQKDLSMLAMPAPMMRTMGVLSPDESYFYVGAGAASPSAPYVLDGLGWPVSRTPRKPTVLHKSG